MRGKYGRGYWRRLAPPLGAFLWLFLSFGLVALLGESAVKVLLSFVALQCGALVIGAACWATWARPRWAPRVKICDAREGLVRIRGKIVASEGIVTNEYGANAVWVRRSMTQLVSPFDGEGAPWQSKVYQTRAAGVAFYVDDGSGIARVVPDDPDEWYTSGAVTIGQWAERYYLSHEVLELLCIGEVVSVFGWARRQTHAARLGYRSKSVERVVVEQATERRRACSVLGSGGCFVWVASDALRPVYAESPGQWPSACRRAPHETVETCVRCGVVFVVSLGACPSCDVGGAKPLVPGTS